VLYGNMPLDELPDKQTFTVIEHNMMSEASFNGISLCNLSIKTKNFSETFVEVFTPDLFLRRYILSKFNSEGKLVKKP
jgi:hypothetical protein